VINMKTKNDNRTMTIRGSAAIPLPFAFVLLALAAGAGGCMVSVDAEIPNVEVTQKGLSFAGVPVGAALGDVSLTQSFSQTHSKLELPEGLSSEVKALDVSLTAKTGITDFSFVRYLRLTMSDDTNNANAIELFNYEKDPAAAPSAVLKVVSANPLNALEKLKTESALFTIDVAGTLPDHDWTVDITVRFGGSIHYQR
jgi:hypothetical protein